MIWRLKDCDMSYSPWLVRCKRSTGRCFAVAEERDWALDPAALEAAVAADLEAGLLPFYLVPHLRS